MTSLFTDTALYNILSAVIVFKTVSWYKQMSRRRASMYTSFLAKLVTIHTDQ